MKPHLMPVLIKRNQLLQMRYPTPARCHEIFSMSSLIIFFPIVITILFKRKVYEVLLIFTYVNFLPPQSKMQCYIPFSHHPVIPQPISSSCLRELNLDEVYLSEMGNFVFGKADAERTAQRLSFSFCTTPFRKCQCNLK